MCADAQQRAILRRPRVLDTIANENKEEMRHGASSVERAASLRIAHDSGQTIPGGAGGEGQLSAGKQGNGCSGSTHSLYRDGCARRNHASHER